jgi:hypothetical protein
VTSTSIIGISGDDAAIHRFFDAFFDRRDEFFGNGASFDFVDKFESGTALARLEA